MKKQVNLAGMIDFTLLKPAEERDALKKLCREARAAGYASVCVSPFQVEKAVKLLKRSAVKVCTVIGFPLGTSSLAVKKIEAEEAVLDGAQELDCVVNQHLLKYEPEACELELAEIVRVSRRLAGKKGVVLKLILECCNLTKAEIVRGCRLAKKTGFDFVKTSTGFGKGGATEADVRLMRKTVGPKMGVKAAGGIRTREDALKMVAAGATRIGTSAAIRSVLLAAMTALLAWGGSAATVKVDFASELGPVKPVNGVGQPPMIGAPANFEMMHYLKEAGIPYSRLHDVGGWFGGDLYADIPNVFRDFSADENDPANYDFSFTDALVKALEDNGIEPFFRLGVTIENFAEWGFKARRAKPPEDFAKWARVCEHVIRHYNEGWANGFRYGIAYWEIWNEPENNPDDSKNPMFQAPFSEYIRLYGVVAPYLKEKFPSIKVGGYGHCGYYAAAGSKPVAAANSTPRTAHFIECSNKFLAAARDNKWPLDFFSFHSYSQPDEAMRQIAVADAQLTEYGFTADRTERIFNEWLPYPWREALGSADQAAAVAAELIELQHGPCAVACIYDARCGTGAYSPLFNPFTYGPHKAYYCFTAFNELRKCGTAVKATAADARPGFHVCAAKGADGSAAVLFANDSGDEVPLKVDFGGYTPVEARLTDATRTDAVGAVPAKLTPHSFAVVRLMKSPKPEDRLAMLVAEDLRHEVRPGGVNGSPFWNANARFFMYPPAFDFPKDGRAACYRFDVVDANGRCHSFEDSRPTASLAPVWDRLPTGWTSVSCRSGDRREGRHVLKGCRVFWKQAPFAGNYPPAARSYRECAELSMGWIYRQPSWKKFLETHDAAECGYWGFCYPSKMVAALVSALCGGAVDDIADADAKKTNEERLAAARLCADWLISISEGPDRPLAYFPPTYHCSDPAKANGVVKDYWGQVMLIYPAAFGKALMKLYAATKDGKYLAQAKGIAETYLKLQGEDGTWFLKMDTKTGREVKPNRLMPIASAIPFLNTLYTVTGDRRYLDAADRAFAYVENGPVKTWNWEGQFEDVGPDGAYRNLTKHDACATALYICERYPGDKARLAVARDILRWSEDQFVCWEKPFPDYGLSHDTQDVSKWILPGVMEQYYWYVPIDASASKLIRTYLALYRAEGNPLDLAKAKALGDAMTRMQKSDGDIPTHWYGEKGCSWWNCLLSDVDAMNELDVAVRGK